MLDTSAVLNLYRYSTETREEFLSVLDSLTNRLWIPAQVAHEFLERRLDVIHDQGAAFAAVRSSLAESAKAFEGEVGRFRRHSSLEAEKLIAQFAEAKEAVLKSLGESEAAHTAKSTSVTATDTIWDRVSALFDGRVGQPFTPQELVDLYKEGDKRYAAEVPPGYKDSKKGEPRKFGDLVLWKQILVAGDSQKLPVIFVTDDAKEDWWRIVRGQRIGARPELVDEYMAASGQRIHFYSPEQFLRETKSRTSVGISEKALGEVEQVSTDANEGLRNVAARRLWELRRRRNSLLRMIEGRSERSLQERRDQLLAERERLRDELLRAQRVHNEAVHLSSDFSGSSEHSEISRRTLVFAHEALSVVEQELTRLGSEAVESEPRRQEHYMRSLRGCEQEIEEILVALGETAVGDDPDRDRVGKR